MELNNETLESDTTNKERRVSDGILKSNLKKLWTSYYIYKVNKDLSNMRETAKKIRSVQLKLGYTLSVFQELV